MADIIPEGTKVSVSSTAPGTSRRSLLRDDDEAWTASSVPAWISLSFPDAVDVAKLGLTFQGGFVAKSVTVTATVEGEEVSCGKVYPEDVNRRQVLELPMPAKNATALRLDIDASTDHHGRVTVYRLEVL